MWHWNSWWAPSKGDPPAVDDPVLWRSPWTAEQSLALQARTWDMLVSSSRAWWSLWLSVWPAQTDALTRATAAAAGADGQPHAAESKAGSKRRAGVSRSGRSTAKRNGRASPRHRSKQTTSASRSAAASD